MSSPIVEQLRRSIEAKHAEAIRALETLAGYLDEPVAQGNGREPAPRKRAPREGTGQIRNAVLAAFQREYLSVEMAAKETGLEPRQVRGVLSAPALADRFTKRSVEGAKQYKYEGVAEA